MKTVSRFLIVTAGLFGATAAMAGGYYGYGPRGGDEGFSPYVGLNIGSVQYREDGLDTITPTAALFRFGVPINRNLALEGRAGGGLGDSSSSGYTVSLDSLYGVYVKGSLPLAPLFSLYAVGGVVDVNMRRDYGFGTTRDSGLSFGVGADINLGNGAGINLEWTRLPSGNNAGYDYTNSMASLGLTWHF